MSSVNTEYRLYSSRFVALFSFSFLSFCNATIWLTFSPIADITQQYYGISVETVNLLLSYGAILSWPGLPFAMFLAQKKGGLRLCLLICAWCTFLATLLRLVPTVFLEKISNGTIRLFFIHFAQILVSFVAPLILVTPAQFSQCWFGVKERATATAIAYISYNTGMSMGFLLGPLLVSVPSQLPSLLYIHVVFAIISLLLVIFCFPSRPPTPPSRSAEIQQEVEEKLYATNKQQSKRNDIEEEKENENEISHKEQSAHTHLLVQSQTTTHLLSKENLYTFFAFLWSIIRNGPYMTVAFATGMLGGVFTGWSGLLSVIMKPLGFSPTDAGWFGFGATLGSMVGGIVVGQIADRFFQKKLKLLLVITMLLCFCSFLWVTLTFPSDWWSGSDPSFMFVLCLLTIAGFFEGGSIPLSYEVLVELSFPLSETVAVAIPGLWGNGGALAILSLPGFLANWFNVLMTLTAGVCLLCVMLVKEEYRRSENSNVEQILT